MARLALLLASLALVSPAFAVFTNPQGIGSQIKRTFLIFKEVPLSASEAESSGWTKFTLFQDECDPNVGIAYAKGDNGPTKAASEIAFYGANGQITGLGVSMWGNPGDNLVPSYWQPWGSDSDAYMQSLTFRAGGASMCDASTPESALVLGDRLILNAQGLAMSLPVTKSQAVEAQWTRGACIEKMGTHWSYDIAAAPNMTWVPDNMLPTVLMFNSQTDLLSAFFFTTNDLQHAEPFGIWEGPIPSFLMCKNWCADSGCTWPGFGWSTLHNMLTPVEDNTCEKAICKV